MAAEDNLINEDPVRTLQSLAFIIVNNGNARIEKTNQFGEEKLISIMNIIGTIGKRPSFTRIQLNKIEEDVMTCKSSKELEERLRGIMGALETSTDITLSKVIQFLLSLSNDLSVTSGLISSLRNGPLKEFKESLLYLFLNALVTNVSDEKYCRKVSTTPGYLVDYANRKGDVLFTVPEAYIAPINPGTLGQDYIDVDSRNIYLKRGLDDNNCLKYSHQINKIDYLKSIYDFFYFLSPSSLSFVHLSTWRTYFFAYEVYNASIIQKDVPKQVRFILRFPINDSNSLYQATVEQNYNTPLFVQRGIDIDYGEMKIIGTGDQEFISRIPESPFLADFSMDFKMLEETLMQTFINGLKRISDLQFQYVGGEVASNYKSSKLAQILNPSNKIEKPIITVDKNLVEFIHQVVKREITHESLSQIIDKFCKEEEITYAFYNRENP